MPGHDRQKSTKRFAEEYRVTLVGLDVYDIVVFQTAIDVAISNPIAGSRPFEDALKTILSKRNEAMPVSSTVR